MAVVRLTFGDREVVLGERAGRIVRFLVDNAQLIESVPVGKLILHFKGRALAPELSQSFRPVREPDEPE
jgi:hypothetical protein